MAANRLVLSELALQDKSLSRGPAQDAMTKVIPAFPKRM